MFHASVRGIVAHRKAKTVGGGRADQRRAAYLHVANRVAGLLQSAKVLDYEGVGQVGLIDDIDRPAVRVDPDAAIGDAVDIHGFTAPVMVVCRSP